MYKANSFGLSLFTMRLPQYLGELESEGRGAGQGNRQACMLLYIQPSSKQGAIPVIMRGGKELSHHQ